MDTNINHTYNQQNELIIINTTIRQDNEGRYCLNDCHRASGFDKSKQPSNWLRLDASKALIEEIRHSSDMRNGNLEPINVMQGGLEQGTYVTKELVYAYAMWISPSFNLQVIRAYDNLVEGRYQPTVDFNDPLFLRSTLLTYTEKCIQLESENKELKPKADGYDLIAGSDGSMCITDTAKHLQIKPKQLFDYLKMNGWIYRRAGGKGWIAYQDRIQQNVLEHKVSQTFTNGESKIREQVLVTPKGLTKLSKIFSVQPV